MIKNLENKMEKMQESINKDLEELKNKHTETNNTITEMKNNLEGINSRISEAEERISELEDRMVEITSEEENRVKSMKRTEDSLRDLGDNIKSTNIRIIGVPEEEEKKKGYEKIFEEIRVENFSNMEKEIVIQVLENSGTVSNAPTFELQGVPEEEEKKKGYEKNFEEIIVENFPNMEKEIINQVQEVQRVPYRINPRRIRPRHILIKLTKTKQKERY